MNCAGLRRKEERKKRKFSGKGKKNFEREDLRRAKRKWKGNTLQKKTLETRKTNLQKKGARTVFGNKARKDTGGGWDTSGEQKIHRCPRPKKKGEEKK